MIEVRNKKPFWASNLQTAWISFCYFYLGMDVGGGGITSIMHPPPFFKKKNPGNVPVRVNTRSIQIVHYCPWLYIIRRVRYVRVVAMKYNGCHAGSHHINCNNAEKIPSIPNFEWFDINSIFIVCSLFLQISSTSIKYVPSWTNYIMYMHHMVADCTDWNSL